jgi:hypothetical protein
MATSGMFKQKVLAVLGGYASLGATESALFWSSEVEVKQLLEKEP